MTGKADSGGFGPRALSFSATSKEACRTALPDTKVWREAELLPASGTTSLSLRAMLTEAKDRFKVLAAIWAQTVLEPCPTSLAPIFTTARSGHASTTAPAWSSHPRL